MAKDTQADGGDFVSGFRPYPAQGFQIQPQANYWQGGNFHMPGINPGAPTMTSNIMSQFPALAQVLQMRSPPQVFQPLGAPFVGGISTPPPATPGPRNPRQIPRGRGFFGVDIDQWLAQRG